jgi:hypothetical protein
MKKIVALLALLVCLFSVPFMASAERSGAKASGFAYNKLKVVYLKELVKQDADYVKANPQFTREDDAVRMTYLNLQTALKNRGVTMYNNPVMLPDKYLRRTVTMHVIVNHAGTVPLSGEEAAEAVKDERNPVESFVSLTFYATKNDEPIYKMTDTRSSKEESVEELIREMTKQAVKELTSKSMKLKDVQ